MTTAKTTAASKTATTTARKPRAPRKTSLNLVVTPEAPKPVEEIVEIDLSKVEPAEGRDLVSELTATVLAPAAKKAPAKRAPRKPAAKATAPKIELTPKAAEAVDKVAALRESVAQAPKIMSEVSDKVKTAQVGTETVALVQAKVVPVKAMPAKKAPKVKPERVVPVSPYGFQRYATVIDQGARLDFEVLGHSAYHVTMRVIFSENTSGPYHKVGDKWQLRLRKDSTFRGTTSEAVQFLTEAPEAPQVEGRLEENPEVTAEAPQEAQEAAPEALALTDLFKGLPALEDAPEAAAE